MQNPETLIRLLREAGIQAFPVYPEKRRPIPPHGCFVTLSDEKSDFTEPLPAGTGCVFPFVSRLHVRAYGNAEGSIRSISEQTETVLLDILTAEHCDIRSVQRGVITYDKTADRLSQETIFFIRGLMYCMPDEGDDHADHN